MLFTVLAGFITSLLLIPFGKIVRSGWGMLLMLLPVVLFLYYIQWIPFVSSGNHLSESARWIPSLGVNLDFRLDGLSLLYILLITGIGVGVFFYSGSYLKVHPYYNRFFAYLCLFMSAMMGMYSPTIYYCFLFFGS